MMRLHQSGPRLRCLRVPTAHRLDRNLAQIRQTAAHVRDLRFDPQPSDSFKAVSPGWLRQLQQTATVQFGQSFATTHLLQSAVRRPPIQPATNATGQGTSRNSRIPADQLLNPFQYDGAKVLTANVHAPRIRGNARGVKCVPRSAQRVCSSLAPCQRAWGPAAKCTPYFLTGPYLGLPAGPLWSPWFCGRNLLTSMAKVASLGPLAAHKVQKTVEVCLIAGTAMPRG